jgi:hypothetical protein
MKIPERFKFAQAYKLSRMSIYMLLFVVVFKVLKVWI